MLTGTLSKIVPAHRVSLELTWIKRDWMHFGAFKAARTKMKLDFKQTCYWCKKPFGDADLMALAGRSRKTNVLLCQGCVDKASQSTSGEANAVD